MTHAINVLPEMVPITYTYEAASRYFSDTDLVEVSEILSDSVLRINSEFIELNNDLRFADIIDKYNLEELCKKHPDLDFIGYWVYGNTMGFDGRGGFAVDDIYNRKTGEFLNRREVVYLCTGENILYSPTIFSGYFSKFNADSALSSPSVQNPDRLSPKIGFILRPRDERHSYLTGRIIFKKLRETPNE